MKQECIDLAMELIEQVIACECKPKTELEAILETLPEEVRKEAKAEYAKLKAEAKPIVKKVEKVETPERTLPGLWGPAYYEGKKYDSPGALAKILGIQTRGAKNMVVAFERAGFEVRGDGEEVEKGETGFVVKRVAPTPKEWQIPVEIPVVKVKRPKKEPQYIAIRNVKGEILGWDELDPTTGLIIPSKRILKGSPEAKEKGLE